jgi:hypothetical protein
MDFDIIKSEISKIKAPKIDFVMRDQKDTSINGLLKHLVRMDNRDKRIYLISGGIYMAITGLYLAWFIVSYENITAAYRVARALLFIAFGILACYLMFQFRRFRKIDYHVPPVEFLQGARDRHRLWSKRLLILFPFLLLVDVALSIEFSVLWRDMNQVAGILLWQLFYLVLIIASILVARWVWKKEKEPVISILDELIAEFQE